MIKFTTINVDGVKIPRIFMDVKEMKADWWDPEGTSLPQMDDPLVSAEVDGNKFIGETFGDLVNVLGLDQR